ncbi:MAG: MFS transporter [Candidatus Odinarchaeota archaeon]|nr:MFS transporter [Candidatus Odinarchaeota archaeon]
MRFPRWKKLAYASGSLAAALSYQAFNAYIFYFYVQVCALPIELYSLGFAIYGVWNALNDPLAGILSDKTRTRWGRRIPYVAFGNIPFMIAFMLVWAPIVSHVDSTLIAFQLFGQDVKIFGLPLDLFIYFTLVGCLFDTFYTIVILAWTALFPEMFPSLEERAEVNAYRQIFSVIGLIFGLAMPLLLVEILGSWFIMGVFLGIITGASVFVSLLGSKETGYYRVEEPLPLIDTWKYTLANRSFLTFVLMNLMIQYTFVLLVQITPLYTQFVLNVGFFETFQFLLMVFLISLIGLIIWNKVVIKVGPKRTAIYALASFAIVLFPLLFVSDYTQLLILAAPIGIALAGPMFIVDILIADVIDEDEVRTGRRREGMYFGTNALIMRLSTLLVSLAVLILAPLGYIEGAVVQPPSAIFGIRLLMSIFPIIGIIIGLLIIRLYPIDKEYRDEIKKKLEKIHAEKISKIGE